MNPLGVRALQTVIWIALAGSLVVQVVLVILLAHDLGGPGAVPHLAVGIVLLGVVCLQVVGVSILRLLTLVRHGQVFSARAFGFVDAIIGAVAAGAVLVAALAGIAVYFNRTQPGDALAPGAVALVCGAALVTAGVALVIYVQRQLLVQATSTDARAARLQAELDGVI